VRVPSRRLAQLRERSTHPRAGAVKYTTTGLAGTFATAILLGDGEPGEEQARRHLQKHWAEFFFTKLSDWESEHEYRFIEPSETRTTPTSSSVRRSSASWQAINPREPGA